MTGWEVRVEGDPSHPHDPEYATLLVSPPIFQVRCRGCGRTLWQRAEQTRLAWPEEAPRFPPIEIDE